MNDLIDRTRPTDDRLRAEWSPDTAFVSDLAYRRARIRPRVSRRSLLVAGAACAVVAVAVPVTLPWLLPTASAPAPSTSPTALPPTDAAPLAAVAQGAAAQTPLSWAEGEFLHVRTTSVQDDAEGNRREVRDDWITSDGWVWSRRTGSSTNGQAYVEEYIFAPLDGWMRPGYAATMPTDAHALDDFLRARVTGSASQDEAVFVAIGDMLKQEAAPPALRAGAIGALALNPQVTVADGVDPSGRTSLVVTFVDEATRPGSEQFLHLDRVTGDLLADGMTFVSESAGPTSFVAVIDLREVVDALPPDIAGSLGTAKVVKDGNATPQPYEGPTDPVPVPRQSYTPAAGQADEPVALPTPTPAES